MKGVSIVIPNWNGGEKIIRCLKSVFNQHYENKEVIVIDNGSTDGSKEEIKKKFDVIVIENKENLGCVKAINQGIKKANHDYILRLDNDVVLYNTFTIKLLVDAIKSHSKIDNTGVVVPKTTYYREPKKICSIESKISLVTSKVNSVGLNEIDKGQYDSIRDIESAPGACMLIRKDVFKKVGLFDEKFLVYYEDLDWCLRLRKKGFKMKYIPHVNVLHDCKENINVNPFVVKQYIKSKLLFMKKHGIWPLFSFIYLFYYTPTRLLKYLLMRRIDLFKEYISGSKEALGIYK